MHNSRFTVPITFCLFLYLSTEIMISPSIISPVSGWNCHRNYLLISKNLLRSHKKASEMTKRPSAHQCHGILYWWRGFHHCPWVSDWSQLQTEILMLDCIVCHFFCECTLIKWKISICFFFYSKKTHKIPRTLPYRQFLYLLYFIRFLKEEGFFIYKIFPDL